MNDEQRIENMTPEQVRREIAERLGWRNITWDDDPPFGWADLVTSNTSMTVYLRVPNWPEDTATALDLCRTLAKPRDYCVLVDWTHCGPPLIQAIMIDIWYADDCRHNAYEEHYTGEGETEALALARLALAVLRTQEGKQ